jgi:serine/threonine-protein kinase
MRYQHVDDILTDLKRVRRGIESGELDAGFTGTSIPATSMLRFVRFAGLALIAALIVLLLYPPGRQAIMRLIGVDRVPEEKHLVVLPFTNLGDAGASQAFCDGLMETLSSKLTQLEKFYGSLWVVPASQVRQENITSPREARQAFGATLAVTGSVQRLGDEVRMTLNLIDTETERQLRSTVIDDSLSNASALQDSMVLRLVSMLEVQLLPEARSIVTEGGTASPKAYDLYLQGRGYLQHFESESNVDSAIAALSSAIDEDPLYALAYSQLGEAHWRKYEMFSRPESEEHAIYYSRYAVELNDELAPVHITLALIYKKTGRYREAVHELQQALELDSASHRAYRLLAQTYEALNELELAESAYRKAIDLKPDYWLGNLDLGFFYVYQGRHGDALEWLDKIVALGPEGFMAWNNLGALYYYLDRPTDASAMWERSLEIEPNYAAYSNLGTLHYLEGRYFEATQMYEKALDMSDLEYLVWGNLASAYYWTPGDRERALVTYQRAIQMAEEHRKVNPSDPEVLSALAEYHAAVGDHREAVSLIDQVILMAPDNPDYLVSAGLVYEELGDRETALKWIGKALQQGYPRSEIERLPELQDLVSDSRFERMSQAVPVQVPEDTGSVEQHL